MNRDLELQELPYYRAAMKKFGDVPEDFRLCGFEWIDLQHVRGWALAMPFDECVVKGARFERDLLGSCVKIEGTDRSCTLTRYEIEAENEPE